MYNNVFIFLNHDSYHSNLNLSKNSSKDADYEYID